MNSTDALLDYVETARNPSASWRQKWNAWRRYEGACKSALPQTRFVQKVPRNVYEDDLYRRARDILEEELQFMGVRGERAPTRAQLQQAGQRTAERLGEEIGDAFQTMARDIYLGGLTQVSQELGFREPGQLTAFHRNALDNLVEAQADTFADFSRDMSQRFNNIIEDAYQQGVVDPGRIVPEMIQEAGHEARSKLEMIAHTETHKIHETARMNQSADIEDELGVEFAYGWGTVQDEKTCAVCQAIMDEVGEGLPREELRQLIIDISEGKHPKYPNLGSKKWDAARDGWPIPHPRCRHRSWRRPVTIDELEATE